MLIMLELPGWQLGEHGEWCKHTNFEFATRAPMMVHVPGLTDNGITTQFYTEHVDLFPTLAEAAALSPLRKCPPGDASFKVALCTEGSSLVPLMKDPSKPIKSASFSQYPRGYQKPSMAVTADGEMLTWETTNVMANGEWSCSNGSRIMCPSD
jgi:arylsulfatase A-like enzyme